jgi:hypothetical protein
MAEDEKLIEIDTERLKRREQQRVKSPNYRELYVNSMNMEVTFNDVKLIFGETVTATHDLLKVEEHIGLTMTPEHALLCLKALTKILKKYENTFGKIRRQDDDDIQPEIR